MTVSDVTDRVVSHHVGGPRFVRPRPRTDHAVQRVRDLYLVRFEPLVEEVADAHGHQPGHVGHPANAESSVPPGHSELIDHVGPSGRTDLRRYVHEEGPENVRQTLQPRVPFRHGFGVLGRKPRDAVAVLLGVVGVELQRTAVGPGLVVGAHRVDLVAVSLELEVSDDRGRHQAHHVRELGDLEVRRFGPRSLGGRRAAGLVAGLQHHHPHPAPSQIGRRDEAVVATADHDRVVGRQRVSRASRRVP